MSSNEDLVWINIKYGNKALNQTPLEDFKADIEDDYDDYEKFVKKEFDIKESETLSDHVVFEVNGRQV